MEKPGFVYVLINPSIPGCVKIGKTIREPVARAAELSAATGVATPFIVVYEAYFHDCDYAESYVHALLEKDGVRLASNREFFVMTVPEAINTVLRAKNDLDARSPTSTGLEDINKCFLDGTRKPWEDIFDEAMAYYFGSDGKLEDGAKAAERFKLAARLGSKEAYVYLGHLYEGAQGIEWLKRGTENGSEECWLELADAYSGESIYFPDVPAHRGNAITAFCKFFESVDPSEFDPTGDRLYPLLRRCLNLMSEAPESSYSTRVIHMFISKFRSTLDTLSDVAEKSTKIATLNALVDTENREQTTVIEPQP